MAFVAFNAITGRIAAPHIYYFRAEDWCETIESKGKHVATVVFNDASSKAVFRIMRMGRATNYDAKHRDNRVGVDSVRRCGPNPFTN
jgi:hypothetical protein